MKLAAKTFAGKDGENFYLLAGRFSMARATKLAAGHWVVTGHIAGDDVEPLHCHGETASARAYHAAMRLAFHDEAPRPMASRTGTTQRGLQAVLVFRRAS